MCDLLQKMLSKFTIFFYSNTGICNSLFGVVAENKKVYFSATDLGKIFKEGEFIQWANINATAVISEKDPPFEDFNLLVIDEAKTISLAKANMKKNSNAMILYKLLTKHECVNLGKPGYGQYRLIHCPCAFEHGVPFKKWLYKLKKKLYERATGCLVRIKLIHDLE